MSDWIDRDRITVMDDGEEIDVFNHVSIEKKYYIRSGSHEGFTGRIGRGDDPTNPRPRAVTPPVAEMLADLGVSPPHDYGILVIDPDDDDVEVL
jgi:hypothetical protein